MGTIGKKCKTCLFWDNRSENWKQTCGIKSYGICEKSKARLSINFANLPVLITSITFGCVYYKNKKDEKEYNILRDSTRIGKED